MKEKDMIKEAISPNMPDQKRVYQNVVNKRKNKFKLYFSLSAAVIILFLVLSTFIFVNPAEGYAKPILSKGHNDIVKVINEFKARENPTIFSLSSLFSVKSSSSIGNSFGGDMAASLPNETTVTENEKSEASDDYSKTNVQTEGFDEGDIVKCDGEYIYKLNTQGFFVIKATNGVLSIASKVDIANYVPLEMYNYGDRLVIIGGVSSDKQNYRSYQIEPLVDCMMYIYYENTDIRVYDITDKENPVLERKLVIEGSYNTSRLIEDEGRFIYLTSYSFDKNNQDEFIPRMFDDSVGDEFRPIPAENIYYYKDIPSYTYLILGEINLNAPENQSKNVAYLGLGGEVYISSSNIYISTYDYLSNYAKNLFGLARITDSACTTRIVKISLDDLKQNASGRIIGSLKDRYSMDEYAGHLRVATTSFANGLNNHLFVLDDKLDVVGSISFAAGESIYSARFNKEKGSVVTFMQVDPYFFFDLSDPKNPKITSEIKKDGVSFYLHYIGDTGYTIGIGRYTQADGAMVTWKGLEISLYYEKDGESQIVCQKIFEGDFYSEILYDPKVLLYDEDKGLIAFPYQEWNYSSYSYKYSIKQGLMVFNFDLSAADEQKLSFRKLLTNLGAEGTTTYDYQYDYFDFITRGLRIGDYIYTVSNNVIRSYTLEGLEYVGEITLIV